MALLVTAAKATWVREGSRKRLVRIFVVNIMVARWEALVEGSTRVLHEGIVPKTCNTGVEMRVSDLVVFSKDGRYVAKM